MHKTLPIIMCLLIFSICCSKDDADYMDLTFESFVNHLTPEMRYQEIVKTFGDPARDIGSGIHIYVYELEDQTEIQIGYTDAIIYAVHVDSNQKELHVLIE